MKEGTERLRAAILDRRVPLYVFRDSFVRGFCYAGEDRVTFRLYPVDRAQLVFHRGSKVKEGADTGPLSWVTNDRAVVPLQDAEARQRDS